MYPKIIDNERKKLGDTLRELSKTHEHLSIATGYWDLPGTQIIFDEIKNYKSIRLLIGQEPLMPRYKKRLNIEGPEQDFPDADVSFDLAELPQEEGYRELVTDLKGLIADGRLEVRVYRKSFLHAKCYIFGNYESETAVGVIGSSNFTRAGLTSNTELNALEDDYRIVKSTPKAETDDYGHLSWFDAVWNDEQTEQWDGRFSELLGDSPVGDLAFSPYDMYIKTLMEVFPDELTPKIELESDTKDVLYAFQYRNAQILINKLEKMGLAMLSDSVGLGKTVTAGAVIKHYANNGATRVCIISPASLMEQWQNDLGEHHGLVQEFKILSLQNASKIEQEVAIDKIKSVDLFVIDEAHNLRNENSVRYKQLQDWFIANPQAKVLLLTATPINNSLLDFASQIQLANKSQITSVPVSYRDEKGKLRKLDFFTALKQIQSRITRSEQSGKDFDWQSIQSTLRSGLTHYLVRSTRQGIAREGGIVGNDGVKREFPDSIVEQVNYSYSQDVNQEIVRAIAANATRLEDIDTTSLDLTELVEQTQRSEHPFDIIPKNYQPTTRHQNNTFANVYQIVLLLGFAPYRPEIYSHRVYGKSIEDIRALGIKGAASFEIQSQLGIHNMLRITLLKRLESSQAALCASLHNYSRKIGLFEKYLEQGQLMSFKDISRIETEYGEDLELAFEKTADDEKAIVAKPADPEIYNIDAIKKDIQRDKQILEVLFDLCAVLANHDDKLIAFAEHVNQLAKAPVAGRKLLLFSYFSDTINYLQEYLPPLLDVTDFAERAEFLTGGNSKIGNITGRFAPKSKKYDLKNDETELDYLFATDVLSEGQNLQDAGVLVNYDLHWNPVRMIQRNGRINRLGSAYENVYIYNLKPEDSLEEYLRLLRRLERKINTIKHSIGTDQDVTGKGQTNPMEFIENSQADKDITTAEKLYTDDGAATIAALEQEESSFFGEDEYVYELRDFLAGNPTDSEGFMRVASIPIGKWGYLPRGKHEGEAIGLARSVGHLSITGAELIDTSFISVQTHGEYVGTPLETTDALALIRTDPLDNTRIKDTIQTDRKLVKRRVEKISARKSAAKQQAFTAKPTDQAVLAIFDKLLPGHDLLQLVQFGITNTRDIKILQAILREAKSDYRNSSQLLPKTITAMGDLVHQLETNVQEDTIIERTDGVLYYA